MNVLRTSHKDTAPLLWPVANTDPVVSTHTDEKPGVEEWGIDIGGVIGLGGVLKCGACWYGSVEVGISCWYGVVLLWGVDVGISCWYDGVWMLVFCDDMGCVW